MENTNPQDELIRDNGKNCPPPEEEEISGEELETVSGGKSDGHRPPPLGRSSLIL